MEQKQMHISVGLNANLIAGVGKPAKPADVKRQLGSLSSSTGGGPKKPKKI